MLGRMMTGTPWAWVLFNVFVLAMLALDLGVFHRKAHEVKFREALIWSGVWISLALLFNLGIYHFAGKEPAVEFLTGYLIEKSLSVDNIFVFLMIFSYFRIPAVHQHKILFWGILGALVMRAIFIFAGIALIEKFHWIIYLFGGFLILTGIKMAVKHDEEIHPEKNIILRWIRKLIPVKADLQTGHFFVQDLGKRAATPLFIALVFIEISDLIFAVDSIPAILSITSDPFIVYTSNVFAILGLRSLYFAVARFAELFEYLHYGLAAILVFVGVKMLLVDVYKIPSPVALAVVAAILVVSVSLSIWKERKNKDKALPR
jgi:tellurite resistance protein TerC